MMEIDLNADLGEGSATDAELMKLITSANICCGLHAGDIDTTRQTIELAQTHALSIGAHPGYADREQFGRRELNLEDRQLGTLLFHQVGGFDGLARLVGVTSHHLKPHGALYNQACRDLRIARPIAAAALLFGLTLVGLPGSQLEQAAAAIRVPFVAEGFADRRYRQDGSLVPRTEPGAFVEDPREAVEQVDWLIRTHGVRTICIHGDNSQALAFAAAVRANLQDRGYRLRAFA